MSKKESNLEKLVRIHNGNIKYVDSLNPEYLDDIEAVSKSIENSDDYSLKFIRYEVGHLRDLEDTIYYVELLVLKKRVFLLSFRKEYTTDDILNLYHSLKEFSGETHRGLEMIRDFINGDRDNISDSDNIEIDVTKYLSYKV